MKTIIEEQGILIICSMIGTAVIGVGTDLFSSLAPMMTMYITSMM